MKFTSSTSSTSLKANSNAPIAAQQHSCAFTNANLRLVSHGHVTKNRTPKGAKLLSASLACGGKTPHQVQRRNERERKRVQAVNRGYEVLARQLSDWEELKNKKLTKAQTLKAAIMYIQHMERLLRGGVGGSSSSSSPFNFSPLFDFGDAFGDDEDEEEEAPMQCSSSSMGVEMKYCPPPQPFASINYNSNSNGQGGGPPPHFNHYHSNNQSNSSYRY